MVSDIKQLSRAKRTQYSTSTAFAARDMAQTRRIGDLDQMDCISLIPEDTPFPQFAGLSLVRRILRAPLWWWLCTAKRLGQLP